MTARSETRGVAPARPRVLIVGVGNELLGDEGLGVHVARTLLARRNSLPAGVDVIEAGTSLLDLLGELARCERVILVDAVRAGGEPGTIYWLEPAKGLAADAPEPAPLSLHEWSLLEALRAAEKLHLLPPELSLVGAEPQATELSLQLSPAVERAARGIVATLTEELLRSVSSPPLWRPEHETRNTPAEAVQSESMAATAASVLYPHISQKAEVCGGKACIDETRIRVMDIVALQRHGHTVEEMLEHFGSRPLTPAEVYSALAYYHDHKDEVDASFAAEEQAEAERQTRKAEYPRRRLGR